VVCSLWFVVTCVAIILPVTCCCSALNLRVKNRCWSHSNTKVEHSYLAGRGCIPSCLDFFVTFCVKAKSK